MVKEAKKRIEEENGMRRVDLSYKKSCFLQCCLGTVKVAKQSV